MLTNYLKIALRQLWRNRLFTTINVLGLAVGLACVVVLILSAQKFLTWDAFHANINRIYSVQTTSNDQAYNQTVYPILDQMLHDYPDIETGTHIQHWNNPWIAYGGKSVQESTDYVDSTFFQVFSFAFKYGNPGTALRNRYSIVLGEKVARNLFGMANPVGRHVTINDTLQYTVTGVLEPIPTNSSLHFEVLLPAANLLADSGFRENANWYNTFATVFVLLKPSANKAALEAKLPQLVKKHFAAEAQDRRLALSPYKDFVYTETPTFGNLITCALVIAAFLLLIISINLINLNMALALPLCQRSGHAAGGGGHQTAGAEPILGRIGAGRTGIAGAIGAVYGVLFDTPFQPAPRGKNATRHHAGP